jgi:glycosyltransferase involved in cell wall biosynthesis
MILKPQLIVFGEDWAGLPSSTQHIIQQMRADYSITWINSLGLRSPKLTWHDFKRVINKAARLCKQVLGSGSHSGSTDITNAVEQLIAQDQHFTVVEPQYLPFPGNPLARRINRLLLHRLLKRHATPATANAPAVIWISLPNAVDALHYLHRFDPNETGLADPVVVYYCCDDFSALAGVDHQAIGRLEAELAEQANIIVATNPKLLDKFPPDKSHLVPHGVDTTLFKQSSERAADLPSGKPIAGFYGSIAAWIDLDLLLNLAQQMPDWNFVLIGTAHVDVTHLESQSNIYFLGAKPHQQLPRYSRHWQVSLLPFHLNEQIMGCNPLKLLEYMATGKPIVSVDFPVVRDYGELVQLAFGAADFAQAIRRSLVESPELPVQRQLKVADESWHSVADKINGFIQTVKS